MCFDWHKGVDVIGLNSSLHAVTSSVVLQSRVELTGILVSRNLWGIFCLHTGSQTVTCLHPFLIMEKTFWKKSKESKSGEVRLKHCYCDQRSAFAQRFSHNESFWTQWGRSWRCEVVMVNWDEPRVTQLISQLLLWYQLLRLKKAHSLTLEGLGRTHAREKAAAFTSEWVGAVEIFFDGTGWGGIHSCKIEQLFSDQCSR